MGINGGLDAWVKHNISEVKLNGVQGRVLRSIEGGYIVGCVQIHCTVAPVATHQSTPLPVVTLAMVSCPKVWSPLIAPDRMFSGSTAQQEEQECVCVPGLSVYGKAAVTAGRPCMVRIWQLLLLVHHPVLAVYACSATWQEKCFPKWLHALQWSIVANCSPTDRPSTMRGNSSCIPSAMDFCSTYGRESFI